MHAVFVILAAAAVSGQPAARVAPDTPAAEHTRAKYLKAKVEGEFKDAALRDVLKEFAHQVDTQLEHPVMWTYADAKAGNLKVTFSCKKKSLEDVLDDLCTKLKLGYFVISDAEHPRDGWVRITMGTERGIGSLGPKAEPKPFKPVAPGSNTNSVIILMSDGRRTTGPDPLDAAKIAADRGVRVFTVGFGTAAGGLIGFEGWSVYVRLDEETLKAVADVTRAEYFYAGTSADLRKVYRNLNSKLVLERKNVEITSLITMGAALLVVLALGLSLWWSSRNLR